MVLIAQMSFQFHSQALPGLVWFEDATTTTATIDLDRARTVSDPLAVILEPAAAQSCHIRVSGLSISSIGHRFVQKQQIHD
jgi:hypothetical protein